MLPATGGWRLAHLRCEFRCCFDLCLCLYLCLSVKLSLAISSLIALIIIVWPMGISHYIMIISDNPSLLVERVCVVGTR